MIEQGFIEVKSTENVSLVQVLNVELGIGESQAIGIIKEEPDEIYRMLRSADFWISRGLFQSLFE